MNRIKGGISMEETKYYKIPISMVSFWFWLAIMSIFIAISGGILFFLLLIPVIVLAQLKNTNYLYNDRELIIKKGLIFKYNSSIALNKIEAVNVKMNLLTVIVQGKPISLMHIKNLNEESDKFIKNWNKNR